MNLQVGNVVMGSCIVYCNLCVVLWLCIIFHTFSWSSSLISLYFWMLNLFMSVKASLTLGREEKPWVKGLVGLNIVVEKFTSWWGVVISFMEYGLHWIHMPLCCFWRYKCMCKKEWLGVFTKIVSGKAFLESLGQTSGVFTHTLSLETVRVLEGG